MPDFSGNDHISKLFDRPTHEAYARRKQMDAVADHINQRFDFQGSQAQKEKLRKSCQDASGLNKVASPDVVKALEERRKEKTRQMRNMLDMQVELHQKGKDQELEEKKAIAAKIAQDTTAYEKEEANRKEELRQKNLANQQAVKKQIAERSTHLRTAGSQILKA